MSAAFTVKCPRQYSGGVSQAHMGPRLGYRAIAEDANGVPHEVEYTGPLSLKQYLEDQGLKYDENWVESFRL